MTVARTIGFAPVRKVVTVRAGQARAFDVFAKSAWWPATHSILAAGSSQQTVVIEPRAGGRWYERGTDGRECDWGVVLAWEPPARMLLGWRINGRFEPDPSVTSEVEVRFIPEGPNQTRVELEHRHIDRFGDTADALHKAVDSDQGWGGLLARYAAAASEPA